MITVRWSKAHIGDWPSLEKLSLEGLGEVSVVYAFWHGGGHPGWLRVGQGVIKQRLADHRKNKEIMTYHRLGLFVSWAAVTPRERAGVERLLVEYCPPLLGERPPYLEPISVNRPAT